MILSPESPLSLLNNSMKRGRGGKGECHAAKESRAATNETLTLAAFHDKIAAAKAGRKHSDNPEVIPR
jgi:hypothetical protein